MVGHREIKVPPSNPLEVEGKHHEQRSSVKRQVQDSSNQLQAELGAAKARILKLENDNAMEAEATKAEMDALRMQLMRECQQTVNAVTTSAEGGVAKLRAEFDERVTKLQRDLRDAETESYNLQQIIDDLRAEKVQEEGYCPTSVNASLDA